MKDGTSARLNAAKERAFRSVPEKLRQTLTVDNGKEFAGHERLSQRLAAIAQDWWTPEKRFRRRV